jgi:sulfite reductase (NADPH) hemoprotein beta-component
MFRAASAGPQKIITANRLGDGRVVFLDASGGWSLAVAEARAFEDGPALDEALAYAARQTEARVIVEPYAVDVEVNGGTPEPIRLRERIRAVGPSVDYGDEERTRLSRATPLGAAAE